MDNFINNKILVDMIITLNMIKYTYLSIWMNIIK